MLLPITQTTQLSEEVTQDRVYGVIQLYNMGEYPRLAGFIRNTLQDVANLMVQRRQTVQFVLKGKLDKGHHFEVRQADGSYVNLSAIFGNRLQQKANDWLSVSLWI